MQQRAAQLPAPEIRKVILRDVARESDVSLKTASRVLNGEPHVLEETALRVRNAMERLGYRPNELARSLKARRSDVVGVVAPLLTHEYVAGCVEAIHHSLQESGKTVILMLSGGKPELIRQQIQLMLERQVEGLILFNPLEALSRGLAAEIGDIATVVLDCPSSLPGITSVIVPNRRSSYEAVEHLISHGYQRLAIVGAGPELYTIKERIKGSKQAATSAGISLQEFVCATEQELSVARLIDLLSGPEAPRAIFALNSYASEQVLHAARSLSLKIPGQLALIGFDELRNAEILGPGLTVISQPCTEIGRSAVRLLMEQQAGDSSSVKLTLPTTLILRQSCGSHRQITSANAT